MARMEASGHPLQSLPSQPPVVCTLIVLATYL